MMMKMIRANWVDLAQGCGVVAGIFLAIHLMCFSHKLFPFICWQSQECQGFGCPQMRQRCRI